MLHWNRNQVYSSVTPTLTTFRWRERHIVNQALPSELFFVSVVHVVHNTENREDFHCSELIL